ncbi:dCTP deaminase [Patescibacteria group bacterium]|nr:dCTP deaminase [Patescibacteria group bacterium]
MSILSKYTILQKIRENKITFSPELDKFQIQPHTIDLRLGYSFYVPKKWEYNEKGRIALNSDYLDTDKDSQNNFDLIKLKPGQYFELLPKEFIISSSLEKIFLNSDNIMANLDARSSIMRRGLWVTSGTIDVRYQGSLTFPIVNHTEQIIKLFPGERICHLTFLYIDESIKDEDALLHGNAQSKYYESTPYSLESRTDSLEEINLIKSGNIDKIKSEYKIF